MINARVFSLVPGLVGLGATLVLSSCASQSTVMVTTPHFDCKAEQSVPLDFARFINSPEAYAGKCVHARGYVFRNMFFPTLETIYSEHHASPFDLSPRRVIGLNAKEESYDAFWARQFVELTGLAVSCRQLNDAAFAEGEREQAEAKKRGSNDAILILGYGGWCHYSTGPAIYVSEWRSIPGMQVFLTSPEAKRTYSNLYELPASDSNAVEIHTAASRWFEAASEKDIPRLNLLGDDDKILRDPNRSPLAFLWSGERKPEIRYFQVRSDAAARTRAGYAYKAFGCVCKADDCADRWPIIGADAILTRDRPYICIEIWRFIGRGEPTTVTYTLQ